MLDLKIMKKFITPDRIKMGAAFLLLACLILPFSSCSYNIDEDGKATLFSKKPAVQLITRYDYPWKEFNPKESSSWLFIFCFLWPIPILIHRYYSGRERLKQVFWAVEPLFIGGASWRIYIESHILVDPAFGAYLALVANGAYGVAWLSEVLIKFIKRRKKMNLTIQI
jgi:hypothetical protein